MFYVIVAWALWGKFIYHFTYFFKYKEKSMNEKEVSSPPSYTFHYYDFIDLFSLAIYSRIYIALSPELREKLPTDHDENLWVGCPWPREWVLDKLIGIKGIKKV